MRGIRLSRMPVKEVESLRSREVISLKNKRIVENGSNLLKDIHTEMAELRLEIKPLKAKEISLNIRGVAVVYDVLNRQLVVDGVKAPAALQNGKLNLLIYADRTGLEIFVNNGLVYMPININIAENNSSYSLFAEGGTAKVEEIKVYELKSIWGK